MPSVQDILSAQQLPGNSRLQSGSLQASVTEVDPAGQHVYFSMVPSLAQWSALACAMITAPTMMPTTAIRADKALDIEMIFA
jgi:hypothetical protein